MAIVIPSKKIYSVKHNKFSKNKINGISLALTKFVAEEELEKNVLQNTVAVLSENEEQEKSSKLKFDTLASGGGFSVLIARYCFLRLGYFKIDIRLPTRYDTNYIQNLVDKFSYNVYGNKKSGTCKSHAVYDDSGTIENPSLEIVKTNQNQSQENYTIEKQENSVYCVLLEDEHNNASLSSTPQSSSTMTISLEDKTKMSVDTRGDGWKVTLYLLCSVERMVMNGLGKASHNWEFDSDINGIYEEYNAEKIQFSVFGNTITLKIENTPVSYGENNEENRFSMQQNDALQENATIGGKPLGQHIADTIIDIYKDGKQTAVIKCGIGEYRDENGDLAISTKVDGIPMHFSIYDVVQPYVMDERGKDVPLSKKNGLPCNFLVLGRKFIYDGEVMQELYLQEE